MPGDALSTFQQFSHAVHDLASGNDPLRDRLIAVNRRYLSGSVMSTGETNAEVSLPETIADDIDLFRAAIQHDGGFEQMHQNRLQDRAFDICDFADRLGRLLGLRDA